MEEKLIILICEAVSTDGCRMFCKGTPCAKVVVPAKHLAANGVTVREKGEWIHDPLSSYGVHVWFCSQCKGEVIRERDFCPNCGADMRGEEDV